MALTGAASHLDAQAGVLPARCAKLQGRCGTSGSSSDYSAARTGWSGNALRTIKMEIYSEAGRENKGKTQKDE